MNCPHCHQPIPDETVLSESGRIQSSMRKTFNSGRSGRPPVMRTCPKCGKKHTGREMRKCPAPPANRTNV